MIFLWCLYGAIQLTWGFIQSAMGFIVFLRHAGNPHSFYHGSILTQWDVSAGLSLGLFIFAPNQAGKSVDQLIVHEYGHTYQSLFLGPLYIPVIGIPSLAWARLGRYKRMRETNKMSYSYFWTEKWANKLGELATGKPSIGDKNNSI